jgi:hypothetical protein
VRTFEKADHVPGGGNRKIPTFKVHWNAEAKVGSLENYEKCKTNSGFSGP